MKLSEKEQLELFVERANEIRSLRLVKNGVNTGLKISWNKEKGLSLSFKDVDEDDLKSFLMTFRHFISKEEPIFIYRIFNICHKRILNDKIKCYLIKSRDHWKSSCQIGHMKFTVNRKVFSPEYITDLFINGYYFHNDKEKRSIINKTFPVADQFLKLIFFNYLLN